MGETPKDVLALLIQLMPGFLTAWVVYGLTTYTKPPQFERVIQALIYSFIVNTLVEILRRVLIFIGRYVQFGTWNHSTELLCSAFIAIILGVSISFFMTNDTFFSVARNLKLTSRTPYPSEWYGAFNNKPHRYVVLHLENNRRIIGYPIEWPTEPTSGHFRLTNAAWLDEDNKEIILNNDESILIPAKQIGLVEFLKNPEELNNAAETA